ncbi:MAG: hypothetical protein IJR34_03485 [Bacteroidales bacterium]|nr:hypothetical protein [Bacteroidales bacterium]
MKNILKQAALMLGVILFFVVLSYVFVPEVLDGKVLNQSDISQWQGMSHEIHEWNKEHPDDKTLWTGSMFGGMPTVGMYDDFEGDYTKWIYKLLMGLDRPVSFLFVTLLGAFLLMLAFGIHPLLSVAGAVAVAFCSYNMQIIQVGHNAKMQAIAFAPWVLAAIVYAYRTALGEYTQKPAGPDACPVPALKAILPRLGIASVLFALALSMQIKANHVQISYYLAILIFIYVLVLLVDILRKKAPVRGATLRNFAVASVLLLVMGGVGIATNANKLIPTYNYTQYTMRGGSELTSDSDTHNSKGLDLDYATQWSYGIEEMPNLMIPNFRGGISEGLPKSSETYKLLRSAGHPEYAAYFQEYWGPQPFTAGPMYLGAICCFLFMLGLFLFKGKEKWWLLVATILASFLAWGNHFMAFTRFFFEYVPMYSKFRSVSMALTVLQLTVPVLAFLVLDKILKGEYTKKEFSTKAWIAFGLTGGFCLLCWLFPSVAGSFLTEAEQGQPDTLLEALQADRSALLVADARRSFFFIVLTFALLLWAVYRPKKSIVALSVISVLVLVDLFSAGKRYLSADDFMTKKAYKGQFAEREADKWIHQDTDPSYRVLDLSVNTFNDAFQCYHHKCVGGYSPVKLQRYQDLIDRYIFKEISRAEKVLSKVETLSEFEEQMPQMPIVSMMNGRYIIVQKDLRAAVNEGAFGNAWLVRSVREAATPDEEIALLGQVDLHRQAVVGKDYLPQVTPAFVAEAQRAEATDLGSESEAPASESDEGIVLTQYAPNELHYQFRTDAPALAVFSEVFHPIGWKARIQYHPASPETAADAAALASSATVAPAEPVLPVSEELPLLRANWLLRAAQLPAGEGEIVMRYEPEDYVLGANISRASSILLYLLLLLSLGLANYSRKQ